MFKIFFSLCLAALIGSATLSAQPPKPAPKQPDPHHIGIIAHRGFHKYEGAAENSIAAMQLAVDHHFYASEFDVQLTGDNIAILYHDNNLQGLPIAELPLSELQNHPNFYLSNGEPIPTLKEFFAAYYKAIPSDKKDHKSATRLFYEIKAPQPDKLPLAVSSAADMVRQYQLFKLVSFISFSLDACKLILQELPGASVGYLGGDVDPAELSPMGISLINYHYSVLLKHPEWVARAHSLGMKVGAWTVNDKQSALDIAQLGVDFITTDIPLQLSEWVQ